jgi:isocitrate dehydrogenase kinase/phosphatase
MVDKAVQILATGFDDYGEAFATITQRACRRFEQRDWQGMRRDTLERLDLYPKMVTETVALLTRHLAHLSLDHPLWAAIKTHYYRLSLLRCDAELAGTFYNSIHRKIFNTVGVDPQLTFIDPPPGHLHQPEHPDLFHLHQGGPISPQTLCDILSQYGFKTPFVDLQRDAKICAIRIDQCTQKSRGQDDSLRIEMVKAPFFRGMSAYLVGRMCLTAHQIPLVFSIHNSNKGLYIDALLTHTDALRILFSFSRAYFHVDTPCPSALVTFLKELMPKKRMAEIYIGLGFHKHGKTELYRDLLWHQKVCSQDRFDFSPGKHGMVMITFNMPGDDLIYKLIRDRFDSPKQTSARQVMERYDFVFKHDRAGRLVDVQTFENLNLQTCCFTDQLLAEIADQAQRAASIKQTGVILHHAYVERRVTPLDLYLQQADVDQAKAAVLDYGQAIKDLARINIFPGDMLIKNFGVTNLGRVVFYDYDELCPLTECNFRRLPDARAYEDDLNAEPWFLVGPNDVFPEEFASFLGLAPDLRRIFLKHHGDLLAPDFWLQTQAQIHAGTWTHIRPYGTAQRLQSSAFDQSP